MLTRPEARLSQGSNRPLVPKDFRVNTCGHIWLHFRVQNRCWREKPNRFATLQWARRDGWLRGRRKRFVEDFCGLAWLGRLGAGAGCLARRPGPRRPEPSQVRLGAGKAAPRARGGGSEAQGAAGGRSTAEQRPQGSRPALPAPSPATRCPSTSPLTSGPSVAPARRVTNSRDSQTGPKTLAFQPQAGVPAQGGPRWFAQFGTKLNFTSNHRF